MNIKLKQDSPEKVYLITHDAYPSFFKDFAREALKTYNHKGGIRSFVSALNRLEVENVRKTYGNTQSGRRSLAQHKKYVGLGGWVISLNKNTPAEIEKERSYLAYEYRITLSTKKRFVPDF